MPKSHTPTSEQKLIEAQQRLISQLLVQQQGGANTVSVPSQQHDSSHLPIPEHIDHCFKIAVVGDMQSGKSNLILSYTKAPSGWQFTGDFISNIGRFAFETRYEFIQGKTIKMEIWEKNQERFATIGSDYCSGIDAVIITVDLTDRSSLQEAKVLKNEMARLIKKDALFILVGTKADLTVKRVVTENELKDLSRSLDCTNYFITSARSKPASIQDMFHTVASLLLQQITPSPQTPIYTEPEQRYQTLKQELRLRIVQAQRSLEPASNLHRIAALIKLEECLTDHPSPATRAEAINQALALAGLAGGAADHMRQDLHAQLAVLDDIRNIASPLSLMNPATFKKYSSELLAWRPINFRQLDSLLEQAQQIGLAGYLIRTRDQHIIDANGGPAGATSYGATATTAITASAVSLWSVSTPRPIDVVQSVGDSTSSCLEAIHSQPDPLPTAPPPP